MKIRIVNLDFYTSAPISSLDTVYSDFRGSAINYVPVIRIFGSTEAGQKICLHVHGVFPYIYIPCDSQTPEEGFLYQIASSLDKTINLSLGQASSNVQHVYKVSLVSGIPFYGFHATQHQFIKLYFYNPLIIKKACTLLQNGSILGKIYQPYESHIPYILQFMIDYNLHGMSFIYLKDLKYRVDPNSHSEYPENTMLPTIPKMSVCKIEADTRADCILNREEISPGRLTTNPGIKAIWDDEKQRRRNNDESSQIDHCLTQNRIDIPPTATHVAYRNVLEEKLKNKPRNEQSPVLELSVYPAETSSTTDTMNASTLENHTVASQNTDISSLDETITPDLNVTSLDESILDEDAQKLYDLLQNLRQDNIERDSILSQVQKDAESEEEGDLSFPLDALQTPRKIDKTTDHADNDFWNDSYFNALIRLPQLDGACSEMPDWNKKQKKEFDNTVGNNSEEVDKGKNDIGMKLFQTTSIKKNKRKINKENRFKIEVIPSEENNKCTKLSSFKLSKSKTRKRTTLKIKTASLFGLKPKNINQLTSFGTKNIANYFVQRINTNSICSGNNHILSDKQSSRTSENKKHGNSQVSFRNEFHNVSDSSISKNRLHEDSKKIPNLKQKIDRRSSAENLSIKPFFQRHNSSSSNAQILNNKSNLKPSKNKLTFKNYKKREGIYQKSLGNNKSINPKFREKNNSSKNDIHNTTQNSELTKNINQKQEKDRKSFETVKDDQKISKMSLKKSHASSIKPTLISSKNYGKQQGITQKHLKINSNDVLENFPKSFHSNPNNSNILNTTLSKDLKQKRIQDYFKIGKNGFVKSLSSSGILNVKQCSNLTKNIEPKQENKPKLHRINARDNQVCSNPYIDDNTNIKEGSEPFVSLEQEQESNKKLLRNNESNIMEFSKISISCSSNNDILNMKESSILSKNLESQANDQKPLGPNDPGQKFKIANSCANVAVNKKGDYKLSESSQLQGEKIKANIIDISRKSPKMFDNERKSKKSNKDGLALENIRNICENITLEEKSRSENASVQNLSSSSILNTKQSLNLTKIIELKQENKSKLHRINARDNQVCCNPCIDDNTNIKEGSEPFVSLEQEQESNKKLLRNNESNAIEFSKISISCSSNNDILNKKESSILSKNLESQANDQKPLGPNDPGQKFKIANSCANVAVNKKGDYKLSESSQLQGEKIKANIIDNSRKSPKMFDNERKSKKSNKDGLALENIRNICENITLEEKSRSENASVQNLSSSSILDTKQSLNLTKIIELKQENKSKLHRINARDNQVCCNPCIDDNTNIKEGSEPFVSLEQEQESNKKLLRNNESNAMVFSKMSISCSSNNDILNKKESSVLSKNLESQANDQKPLGPNDPAQKLVKISNSNANIAVTKNKKGDGKLSKSLQMQGEKIKATRANINDTSRKSPKMFDNERKSKKKSNKDDLELKNTRNICENITLEEKSTGMREINETLLHRTEESALNLHVKVINEDHKSSLEALNFGGEKIKNSSGESNELNKVTDTTEKVNENGFKMFDMPIICDSSLDENFNIKINSSEMSSLHGPILKDDIPIVKDYNNNSNDSAVKTCQAQETNKELKMEGQSDEVNNFVERRSEFQEFNNLETNMENEMTLLNETIPKKKVRYNTRYFLRAAIIPRQPFSGTVGRNVNRNVKRNKKKVLKTKSTQTISEKSKNIKPKKPEFNFILTSTGQKDDYVVRVQKNGKPFPTFNLGPNPKPKFKIVPSQKPYTFELKQKASKCEYLNTTWTTEIASNYNKVIDEKTKDEGSKPLVIISNTFLNNHEKYNNSCIERGRAVDVISSPLIPHESQTISEEKSEEPSPLYNRNNSYSPDMLTDKDLENIESCIQLYDDIEGRLYNNCKNEETAHYDDTTTSDTCKILSFDDLDSSSMIEYTDHASKHSENSMNEDNDGNQNYTLDNYRHELKNKHEKAWAKLEKPFSNLFEDIGFHKTNGSISNKLILDNIKEEARKQQGGILVRNRTQKCAKKIQFNEICNVRSYSPDSFCIHSDNAVELKQTKNESSESRVCSDVKLQKNIRKNKLRNEKLSVINETAIENNFNTVSQYNNKGTVTAMCTESITERNLLKPEETAVLENNVINETSDRNESIQPIKSNKFKVDIHPSMIMCETFGKELLADSVYCEDDSIINDTPKITTVLANSLNFNKQEFSKNPKLCQDQPINTISWKQARKFKENSKENQNTDGGKPTPLTESKIFEYRFETEKRPSKIAHETSGVLQTKLDASTVKYENCPKIIQPSNEIIKVVAKGSSDAGKFSSHIKKKKFSNKLKLPHSQPASVNSPKTPRNAKKTKVRIVQKHFKNKIILTKPRNRWNEPLRNMSVLRSSVESYYNKTNHAYENGSRRKNINTICIGSKTNNEKLKNSKIIVHSKENHNKQVLLDPSETVELNSSKCFANECQNLNQVINCCKDVDERVLNNMVKQFFIGCIKERTLCEENFPQAIGLVKDYLVNLPNYNPLFHTYHEKYKSQECKKIINVFPPLQYHSHISQLDSSTSIAASMRTTNDQQGINIGKSTVKSGKVNKRKKQNKEEENNLSNGDRYAVNQYRYLDGPNDSSSEDENSVKPVLKRKCRQSRKILSQSVKYNPLNVQYGSPTKNFQTTENSTNLQNPLYRSSISSAKEDSNNTSVEKKHQNIQNSQIKHRRQLHFSEMSSQDCGKIEENLACRYKASEKSSEKLKNFDSPPHKKSQVSQNDEPLISTCSSFDLSENIDEIGQFSNISVYSTDCEILDQSVIDSAEVSNINQVERSQKSVKNSETKVLSSNENCDCLSISQIVPYQDVKNNRIDDSDSKTVSQTSTASESISDDIFSLDHFHASLSSVCSFNETVINTNPAELYDVNNKFIPQAGSSKFNKTTQSSVESNNVKTPTQLSLESNDAKSYSSVENQSDEKSTTSKVSDKSSMNAITPYQKEVHDKIVEKLSEPETRCGNNLLFTNSCENYDESTSNEVTPYQKEVSRVLSPKSNLNLTTYLTMCESFVQSVSANGGPCIIVPKYNPPSRSLIESTFLEYNIPEVYHQEPFYSNVNDVTGSVEVGVRILKIPSKNIVDIPEFESSYLGLNHYRKLFLEELYPNEKITSKEVNNYKLSFCKDTKCYVTPAGLPPSRFEVELWLKDSLIKKHEAIKLPEKKKIFIPCSPGAENDGSDDSLTISPCTPLDETLKNIEDNVTVKSSFEDVTINTSPIIKKNEMLKKHRDKKKLVEDSKSNLLQEINNSSNDSCKNINVSGNISKLNINKEKKHDSYQITGVTLDRTNNFAMSCDNLQDAKAVCEYLHLTVMCMEVIVETRSDHKPNPNHDVIQGIVYKIFNDVPEDYPSKRTVTGCLLVNNVIRSSSEVKFTILDGVTVNDNDIKITDSEEDLLYQFTALVTEYDPDILVGYEIEMLSWGYLIERGYALSLNLISLLSRIPVAAKNKNEDVSDLTIPGRIVLDFWRLLRHEVALQSYSFENIVYHILHLRVPYYSLKNITYWWNHPLALYRCKVLKYYFFRVESVLKIMDQLDFIGRTSELAKLFGIQFFEVLSRGSQFRVESMMLRLAKPLNYIPVSPSVQQRAKMKAPESLPLIMEPESKFYTDPVIVLDFQSLYPSMIIAYNYCFSTCLGRIEHLGGDARFEFGATQLKVSRKRIKSLHRKDLINISPVGIAYVKKSVREGILPRMLQEILDTRLMVKKSLKQNAGNKTLEKILDARQLGLKLIANVTYGYTAANFSGRMACVEVADSVVSKGRETLQRAINLVEKTTKWRAKVVYGDTDSMFVLVAGRSRKDAFKIGAEIAEAVTNDNPSPVKLKLEKIFHPCILQTKKRYVGYMYESPDQNMPEYCAKGIETVRRDGCPAVSKMLEKCLKLLFDTRNVSLVRQYVIRQFTKILSGRISIQDLTFAKEYRGSSNYRPGACVPALELARKWLATDKRSEPRRGERVPYVIINGPPGLPLIRLVRSPRDVIADPSLRLNALYYITKVIIPPINRCFLLIGADLNNWFNDMPRKQFQYLTSSSPLKGKKSTISQYFSTTNCAVCGQQSQEGLCEMCLRNPQDTSVMLHEKIRILEKNFYETNLICETCCGTSDKISCISLDCPVYYRRIQTEKDIQQSPHVRQLISILPGLDF